MSLEPDLQWHPVQGEQDILSHISCEPFRGACGATTPGCALFCTRHGQQRGDMQVLRALEGHMVVTVLDQDR